jgi:polar amino acid transport system permease protein
MSIKLIIPSGLIGLMLGIVVGTLRTFGHAAVQKAANAYATVFRGTPLLVQLFLLYFGLPTLAFI